MSGVATAIAGGAILGAAATENAANTAADTQRAGLAQQAQLAAPYTQLGQAAIPTYEALLGISPQGGTGAGGPGGGQQIRLPNGGMITIPSQGGGGPSGQSIQQTLANLPGYQFTKQQGLQATEAQLSALGLGNSGNLLTAVDQYTTGLADQNYQQFLQDMLAPIQIGQGAAAGQAANIGNTANNLTNIGLNEAAGISKSIGGGINNLLTYNTLQNLNSTSPGDYSSPPSYMPTPSSPSFYANDPSIPLQA